MSRPATRSPETLAAQALGQVSPPFHDLAPPVHLSTTFERAADGSYPGGRVYSRDASPAYDQAEALLCALEGGHRALLFASGMAAATAVLHTLKPGEAVVAPRDMYWALRNWLQAFCAQWGIGLAFYDNASTDDLADTLRAVRPRLLWIETPSNPLWDLTDIAAAVALAREVGARVAVDSTVATPVFIRPLALGADIVMHSATKYLNGHSDVVAGALVAREDSDLWQTIRRNRNLGGAVPGPFEAWLLLRGMRTLHLRVRQASASALAIAQELEGHPGLIRTLYPGLPSPPRPRAGVPPDAGRVRRHAVDPRGRRRAGSPRGDRAAAGVPAGNLAGFGGESGRTSRQRRRAGQRLPGGPDPALRRHRIRRRSAGRPARGAGLTAPATRRRAAAQPAADFRE